MKKRLIEDIRAAKSAFDQLENAVVSETEFIADHLLENGVIVPQFKVGDEVWVIDYEDGEPVDVSCVIFLATAENFIIATAFINDYDIDETIEYHIDETQENFDTDLKVYQKRDCFSTCEEAEKALKERNNEIQ